MRDKFISSLVLFLLQFNNIFASVDSNLCYVEQGVKVNFTHNGELRSQNCKTMNKIEFNNGTEEQCGVPRNIEHPLFEPGKNIEKFELHTVLGQNESGSITVLNVTISNVTFHKLKIKLQNLNTGGQHILQRTIEFERNEKPQKLSLFFAIWFCVRTKMQFFADESYDGFFKEYLYTAPSVQDVNKYLQNNNCLRQNDSIFAYVDTTIQDRVYLHVQPLPEYCNITSYEAEFRRIEKQNTSKPLDRFKLTLENLTHEQTRFEDDYYEFWLIPVVNNETKRSVTHVARFCMQIKQDTLIIKIVKILTIPVIIFLALYVGYIIFRRHVSKWLRDRRPVCLIVYSAVHDEHVNVLIELVSYLKGCKIDVMIDLLDIPKESYQNPGHWCDKAFQRANAVVVVVPPKCNNAISFTKTPYIDLDQRALQLIHENRCRNDKIYLTVLLPYCNRSDVPIEARSFDLVEINKEKDLKNLVDKIHNIDYTKVSQTPNGKVLLKRIALARECVESGKPYSDPTAVETRSDITLSSGIETMVDIDFQEQSDEETTYITSFEDDDEINKFRIPIRFLNLRGTDN